MEPIDLGKFPEVIEDLIRDYLTQEIGILELEKLGELSFPDSGSELEKDFDIKLPEFMSTTILCRNWKLIKKIGNEKVLIICNPRKYTSKQESCGKFCFYNVKMNMETYLDSILKDNKITCKECKTENFGTDIYMNISAVIEKFPDCHVYTERDVINFIGNAHNYVEFLCEECFTKNPKSKYEFFQKSGNKNIYLSESFYTLENAYICMQRLYLGGDRHFPGYTETFIVFEDGTKFIQTSKNYFGKIHSIKI